MRLLKTLIFAGLCLASWHSAAAARSLGVEVWTDRGDDGIYQPGQAIQVKVRATDDAYLIVYGVDTEGEVSLLYPARPTRSFVEGRRTYRIPAEDSRYDLLVDDKIGQGFIVAIASREPFRATPWYLRPLDARGEDLGYTNYDEDDANDGITEDGRISGDPYVAMERIRRRLLGPSAGEDDFSSAYTSYYVHQAVRYPRYICNDCHRPGRWAWWDGFDPYYAHCSVIDFRVNWSWVWGPTCWNGFVPYYYYVVSPSCPPGYRHWAGGNWRWSSWDGWARWNGLWGSNLQRHKTRPPAGYNPPPSPGKPWRPSDPTPPGFLTGGVTRNGGPDGIRQPLPIGRRERAPGSGDDRPPVERTGRGGISRPGVDRSPARPADEAPDAAPRRGTIDRPSPRQPMRPADDGARPPRPSARPTPSRPAEDSAPPPRPSARPAPAEPRQESPPSSKPEAREPSPHEPAPAAPAPSKSGGSEGGGRGKSRGGG